jgi:CheY-like chemotaxis protein
MAAPGFAFSSPILKDWMKSISASSALLKTGRSRSGQAWHGTLGGGIESVKTFCPSYYVKFECVAHLFAAMVRPAEQEQTYDNQRRLDGSMNRMVAPSLYEIPLQCVPWTALVVEDESIIAGAIEDALAGMGASHTAFARTTREAVDWMQRTSFTIAVIDWHLGGETAKDLVAALIEQGTVPIVVTGAHHSEFVDLDGGVQILTKPFRDETLRAAVSKALAFKHDRAAE